MISNENRLLVKYIFPNVKCLEFFKEQLFEELKEVVPETLCYSKTNENNRTRSFNKNECMNLIREFFLNNEVYKNEIEVLYKKQIDCIIEDILFAFIFLLNPKINLFEDSYSVCYNPGINISDFV